MDGRLNIFQKTMLQWNDLHPYNVVHAFRVPAELDWERLTKAVNGTLEAHGLTGLALNRDRGTYRYHGGAAACEIKKIPVWENPREAFCAEIERQLNKAFVQGERFSPFRFFVLPEPDAFWLGVVYFHAVADAESVALLAREMIEIYLPRGGARTFTPVNLRPESRRRLLQQPGLIARKIAAAPALARRMRTSRHIDYFDENEFTNNVAFFSLGAGDLASLRKTAKAWNVTLNDLFLGLLLKCLANSKSDCAGHPLRRKISVGFIVNQRKDLGLEGRRAFGLFLGSLTVSHEVPAGIGLKELAEDIRRQTLASKRGKLYLGAPLEMALGRFVLSWFSAERRRKIYRRHYPLWGGITNVNLNSLWEQPPGEKPVDCFRAVSTGPVTPLVLSVTTVRDVVNFGITYRSTVFSGLDIGQIKDDFLKMLEHLENRP
jgi:NRPS condensation-like uncharacterized protein